VPTWSAILAQSTDTIGSPISLISKSDVTSIQRLFDVLKDGRLAKYRAVVILRGRPYHAETDSASLVK
jgi:hypothetical protein